MPKTQSLKVSISGVRGVIGETLTPELVCRFAEAFGAYVGRGPVIVGRDTRPSGLMVQQAVHAGLLAVGCKIVDVGVVPTPSLLIKVDEYKAVGAIAITAIHNPNQWNALKFVGNDGIRIDWPDKWALVRPSNTEPVIRLTTEASTLAAAQELNDSIKSLCQSLLQIE
jgi:phosphomannomutase